MSSLQRFIKEVQTVYRKTKRLQATSDKITLLDLTQANYGHSVNFSPWEQPALWCMGSLECQWTLMDSEQLDVVVLTNLFSTLWYNARKLNPIVSRRHSHLCRHSNRGVVQQMLTFCHVYCRDTRDAVRILVQVWCSCRGLKPVQYKQSNNSCVSDLCRTNQYGHTTPNSMEICSPLLGYHHHWITIVE